MISELQLQSLLSSSETQWVERKTSYNSSEVVRTVVAFANSVPEDQHAVLFIGISQDGTVVPVQNADKCQRDIRTLCEQRCFPPVNCHPVVVRHAVGEIIAVVVAYSKEKPHFAGHAFVRIGSETCKASRDLFEQLIASRNTKAGRLLREKGRLITVALFSHVTMTTIRALVGPITNRSPTTFTSAESFEARIIDCDAFVLHYMRNETSEELATGLDAIEIGYDVENRRAKLTIGRKQV